MSKEWNEAIDACLEIIEGHLLPDDRYNDDGGDTAQQILEAVKSLRKPDNDEREKLANSFKPPSI